MNRLARRFLVIGLAIASTLLIGTVGFTLIDHYPPFDAFYMTLTTMTTVGYGEIHPLSHAGRIFNSFLIVFGVTTIFIAIGAMTQTIIELEFGDAIGKRRNKRMIDKLKDHYIICGFGRVGRGAAAELQHAGVPFVVVDISPERVERAMLAGMLAVAADSTHDETLRQVGIERARGLVAALATDADNLFVLLSAKGLNPRIYVATRAAEEGAEEKMRRAGADAVFAPYVDHRPPPGAIAAAAPRRAVPRLHHQGHRRGYRHRTGARLGHQRDGVQDHPRDAARPRRRRDRHGHPQGRRRRCCSTRPPIPPCTAATT